MPVGDRIAGRAERIMGVAIGGLSERRPVIICWRRRIEIRMVDHPGGHDQCQLQLRCPIAGELGGVTAPVQGAEGSRVSL
jgi:hypothetical protein